MATDSEIVRFAAPWPGTAARLLEGLADLGPGTWSLEVICRAAGSGTEPGHASQILAGLAMTGLCVPTAVDDSWLCEYAPAELKRLANILDGAEHFRRMRLSPSAIEFAVTMPMSPSYLETELSAMLGRPGGYLTTSDAFARLARAAARRLVIMTPFIDAGGFRWIRRVFEAARTDCRKILVLRDSDRYAVELGVLHASWLQALRVEVCDYHLSHDTTSGRSLPIETFHAKLVVADESLAYVGSANLLSSSEGVSLETGLVVEGAPASQAARLIDAVLRVSRVL
ncbi:PLD-like domain-containing protein [Enhydrobacter aerosaccus]|uniref:Phospholipase D n=1 Tax=Enhydrobacter aerosaccus TaxID=225324 RepID=A0A1T4JLC4_9HYPH|nr:phospholipase D-like domain-containing protein [Enhydrobacter aerosaccus]SJZ30928.1 PLD-like domain-containing protein [Enhydrobacter aerosaccus]